jgi:hypothetical protein
MNRASLATLALLGALPAMVSCETPPPQSHGVDVPEGPCGHALVVIAADSGYASTSVGVLGWDGEVLSPVLLTSASAPVGLSVALSGDVIAPTTAPPSGIVLIDRANAVVSWVDPRSGDVAQLNVVTKTNPHDYLEVAPNKAYVSRYDQNPAATGSGFDQGGDVVVIDPGARKIVSRIDLAPSLPDLAPGILPHPDRMVAVDGKVVLLVPALSKNFMTSGDSALVRIDPATDTPEAVVALPGLRGCNGLALSPSNAAIAVACSGTFAGNSTPTLDDAGLALVDVASFQLSREIFAPTIGELPPGFAVAFAGERALLVPTFGSKDAGTRDQLLLVDVDAGTASVVATSEEAFEFGEVRCAAACGACFMTDANAAAPVVRRYDADASGNLSNERRISLGDGIGTLPRYLGAY